MSLAALLLHLLTELEACDCYRPEFSSERALNSVVNMRCTVEPAPQLYRYLHMYACYLLC